MSKFDIDFDYLQLLGIAPAEALLTPAALGEKIKAKKKEWTSQSLNPLYQQAARSNLERSREFEGLLGDDPAALVAYVNHIKQSRIALRSEHEERLMPLLALATGGKNELTARQRELLAKEAKAEGLPDFILDEVLKARSIAIVAVVAKSDAEQPKIPVRTPALDGTVFNEIQNWLKVLGKKSLYELLDLPNMSPPARLVSTAQLLFAHWSKVLPKTNTSTAWEKTLQSCLTYLKETESKARYDRALFNQRIQRFVARIDLVIAGSSFGTEEQVALMKIGAIDLGLTAEVIEQCLAARMAEKGLGTESRATVVVQVQGQVRCLRCGAWNGPKQSLCRECSSSLHRKCENPACRPLGPIPIDAKACPNCGLPTVQAIQYRTLLRLADVFLESGSYQAALSVCQHATHILPGPSVDERIDRASKIRILSSTAKSQAAAQAWTAAGASLKELSTIAPRLVIQKVPSLEKVSQFVAESIEKMRKVPIDTPPLEAAKVYLAILRRWTDCDEAFVKLRAICQRFEAENEPRRALQLTGKLLESRPDDSSLKAAITRLEPLVRLAQESEADRQSAVREFVMALKENRLFAAERSILSIEGMPGPGLGPLQATVDDVRARLREVQRELADVKLASAGEARTDPIIQRYLNILSHCRDCREALLALQVVKIDSPDPPEGLAVRREGNRRVLTWRAASSTAKRPTSYVVQRSMTRPASRQVDTPFQTIYEGDATHCVDDEVAHGGVILRYMVHAVALGKIDVEGTTVRTYEVASAPSAFPPVLSWHEVMNLKSTRRDRALELTWYPPHGYRQVLIERWPGGPDDRAMGAAILPQTSEGRLVDDGLGERMIHTYQISCLFDGPDGQFRTPGVTLTDGIVAGPPKQTDVPQTVLPLSNGR
jgi:hypothetical protein